MKQEEQTVFDVPIRVNLREFTRCIYAYLQDGLYEVTKKGKVKFKILITQVSDD